MPLYLVRWGSTFTVSLVRAQSEEHLIDILDEVGDPARCTWSVYNGPLMIDLTVPVEVDAPEDVTGLVRTNSVKVRRPAQWPQALLEVQEPDDCETVAEMKDAILHRAFPLLAEGVDVSAYGDDDANIDVLCLAFARDASAQSRRLATRGVAMGEDGRLRRSRGLAFRFTPKGVFEPLSVIHMNDFLAGLRPLPPDPDGLVRLVHVDVVVFERVPVEAVMRAALQLRASPEGQIIAAHRADAFSEDLQGEDAAMRRQRNKAVHWELAPKEWKALEKDVCARVGSDIRLRNLSD